MANITNKIIDIHNHTLPGVDDGAINMEEALANIKYLKNYGVTDIVLTSHYINNTKYQSNVTTRNIILNELREKASSYGVNLYLGNEVFASEKVIESIKNGDITTLNQSRYLLIEFPLNQVLNYIEDIICDINDAGYIPVIAHPERYEYFKNNYNKLEDILEYDCILQCNIESIVGKYGTRAKKLIKRLLKENKVKVLATDFHHISHSYLLENGLRKLKRIVKEPKLNELLYENPKKIINNENL